MKANEHLQAIDEQTVKAIVQKLDELLKLIEPYVTPLTPQERHDLPKMGPKTLAFVEKCHDFAGACGATIGIFPRRGAETQRRRGEEGGRVVVR